MPRFCRHNRLTADCPLCSKGTALDSSGPSPRRRAPSGGSARTRRGPAAAPTYTGPYGSVGPYERDGERYEVRLERVPGGVRLAEWAGGSIRRRAPELAAADLATLVEAAALRAVLASADAGELARSLSRSSEAQVGPASPPGGQALEPAPGAFGASPGRSGELRDELRVERLSEGRLRIARWILRPNAGWELQEAPVMLPASRYAEALADLGAREGIARSSDPVP